MDHVRAAQPHVAAGPRSLHRDGQPEKLADCDEWEHVDSETAKGSDSTDPQPFDEAKARLLERHGLADSDISDEIEPW